jgi:hypothetical protein
MTRLLRILAWLMADAPDSPPAAAARRAFYLTGGGR